MIISYNEPGIAYDDHRVTYDGVFSDASVWPAESSVVAGVHYGPTGTEYTGDAFFGGGSSIISCRSDVHVSTPTLRIASRQKRRTEPQEQRELSILRAKPGSKYAYATTSDRSARVFVEKNELFITTTTESISV